MSLFLNWGAQKGWRTAISLKMPAEPREHAITQLPSLYSEEYGNRMTQAILDSSLAAFDGEHAAHYLLRAYGGVRVAEAARMSPKDFLLIDGTVSVPRSAAKTREQRSSEVMSNLRVMVEYLIQMNLFNDQNFKAPTKHRHQIISLLAGFTSQNRKIVRAANNHRERILAQGKSLQEEKWNIPWIQNGMRRTDMSMYKLLCGDEEKTVIRSGTSKKMFEGYSRRCSKHGAADYFTLIYTCLSKQGLNATLPKGHKLDIEKDSVMESALSTVRSIAAAEKEKLTALVRGKENRTGPAVRRAKENVAVPHKLDLEKATLEDYGKLTWGQVKTLPLSNVQFLFEEKSLVYWSECWKVSDNAIRGFWKPRGVVCADNKYRGDKVASYPQAALLEMLKTMNLHEVASKTGYSLSRLKRRLAGGQTASPTAPPALSNANFKSTEQLS